jgi:nucleoid-associated protein YgaU
VQSRAQNQSQTTDQDVAEAARQERARKEAQQKKSQHVYTEEDLHRAQILTPEDHAQVVAKKNQQPTPPAEKSEQPSQQAVEAESLPPDAPLGDVARHFRQQKQSQKLQQSADFHLPFADAPVLASPDPIAPASPNPPVLPSSKPLVFVSPSPRVPASPKLLARPALPNISKPLAPRFIPFPPPVKRSPFERPKYLTPEPRLLTPTRPTAESKVVASPHPPVAPKFVPRVPTVANPKSIAPARPLTVPMSPARPSVLPNLIVPVGPSIHSIRPTKPPIAPGNSTQQNVITVKPGDSLWKLAKQNLGSGLRWRELLSANPTILNPNRIFAGSQLILPAANLSPQVVTKIIAAGSLSASTSKGSNAAKPANSSAPAASSPPPKLPPLR